MSTLYTKYRPTKLSEVIGQDAVIESIEDIVSRGASQAFLFSGPAGVGKTSIARIIARRMGCKVKDRLDIDGATYTGIDDMRKVQDILRYKPFGESEVRAIIGDEVHRLSQQAWDSLLKSVEEPPKHVIWLFCTTNPDKVPRTIKTRCTSYELKAISDNDLTDLVDQVAKAEGFKIPEQIRGVVVREARGSARQALVNLEKCRNVTSREKAAEILRTVLESDTTIELCRHIVKGGSWKKAMSLVTALNGANPEGFRILMCNYLSTTLQNATADQETLHLLSLLENFSVPFNSAEGNAPLMLAIGHSLFSERGTDG